MAKHPYPEWVDAYERFSKPKRRNRTEIAGPCPLCGGDDRFHIRDAGGDDVTVGCRRCAAPFLDFVKFLFPGRESSGGGSASYPPSVDTRPVASFGDPSVGRAPAEPEPTEPEPAYGCTIEQLAARTHLSITYLTSSCRLTQSKCWVSESVGEVDAVRVPYLDETEEHEIGAKFRVLVEGKDKYRYERGSKAQLYGLNWIPIARATGGKLWCVEGESDCWTLWRHEIAAIGIPGSTNYGVITAEHMEGITRLFVITERDEAGEKFPIAIAAHLKKLGCSTVVIRVRLPEKDVSEYFQKKPTNFRNAIIEESLHSRGLRPSKIQRNRVITARELVARDFPPARWLVPDLIPTGLVTLFAAPKVGKSWLSVQLAMAVSRGIRLFIGYDTVRGDVLCIDKEQIIGAQMKARFSKHGGAEDQNRCFITDDWPRLDEGGLDEFDMWLEDHPDCRLITVDVWSTIKNLSNKKGSGANAYDAEYSWLQRLRDVFLRREACCLLVHHDNKNESAAITDAPSGTKALSGASNVLLWIRRQTGQLNGTITVSGRDVTERTLNVTFSAQDLRWDLTHPDFDGPNQ